MSVTKIHVKSIIYELKIQTSFEGLIQVICVIHYINLEIKCQLQRYMSKLSITYELKIQTSFEGLIQVICMKQQTATKDWYPVCYGPLLYVI